MRDVDLWLVPLPSGWRAMILQKRRKAPLACHMFPRLERERSKRGERVSASLQQKPVLMLSTPP